LQPLARLWKPAVRSDDSLRFPQLGQMKMGMRDQG